MAPTDGAAALAAVRDFADLMLDHGRAAGGTGAALLFAGQLNPRTRRLPAGTPEDPGLLAANREVAGCGPTCQNLLFDFGLLDVLRALTAVTGDQRYEVARHEYLAHYLRYCRYPESGYFPWGEHVGYDLVQGRAVQGDYKGWHEVKAFRIPWEQLWAADPMATRHEIEVALWSHICDPQTMVFNRHASMDGTPNIGLGPCSLADSAGAYIYSWSWLYRQTRDPRLLDRARRIASLLWDSRSPETGLLPSSEDRPDEMWYGEPLSLACLLLWAADTLGLEGAVFGEQARAYLSAYEQYAWDTVGHGFFDTLNTVTGQPVIGPSAHYPDIARPRHLAAWRRVENSNHLAGVVTAAAIAYDSTGESRWRYLFDRALGGMAVKAAIARGTPMVSGDAAGVLAGLVCVARRSHDSRYLAEAAPLVDYVLQANRANGMFTGGGEDAAYYCNRLGAADLAAAVLGYALTCSGHGQWAPPLRNPYGAVPW